MQIRFSFQNIGQDEKEILENYAGEEKLKSLTRLLQHGNYELANLDVRAKCLEHHNNYEIKMDLKIKDRVLVSEQTSFGLIEAFDLALEKIVTQLRKTEEIKHTKILHKIRRSRLLNFWKRK